jgi:sulfur relay (sulfurtransferase) DsrC/TusE family protein
LVYALSLDHLEIVKLIYKEFRYGPNAKILLNGTSKTFMEIAEQANAVNVIEFYRLFRSPVL